MTGNPPLDHDYDNLPTFNLVAHLRKQEQECIRYIQEDEVLARSADQVNAACGSLFWLQRMINQSISVPIEWPRVSALYLLNRAIDDIRVALATSMGGYPVQALSLLSSVFEVEVALKEIGTDINKSQRWLREEGHVQQVLGEDVEKQGVVKRVKKGFDKMGELFYLGLEVEDDDLQVKIERVRQRNADRYATVYKQLCGYKHIEPAIQREFGAGRTAAGMEVRPGPQWNPRTRMTLLASHEMMVNLALHVFSGRCSRTSSGRRSLSGKPVRPSDAARLGASIRGLHR